VSADERALVQREALSLNTTTVILIGMKALEWPTASKASEEEAENG
jgi:hypothetical protein